MVTRKAVASGLLAMAILCSPSAAQPYVLKPISAPGQPLTITQPAQTTSSWDGSAFSTVGDKWISTYHPKPGDTTTPPVLVQDISACPLGGNPTNQCSGQQTPGPGAVFLTAPTPRKQPRALKAGVALYNGLPYYLAYVQQSDGTYKVRLMFQGTVVLEEGKPIMSKGTNLGTLVDFFGLKIGEGPRMAVGLFYYPTDDPSNLYEGIFQMEPSNGTVWGLWIGTKVTEGHNFVLLGVNQRQIDFWDQLFAAVKDIDRDTGNFYVFMRDVKSVVDANDYYGGSVVVATTAAGQQMSQFIFNRGGFGIVVDGQFYGQPFDTIIAVAGWSVGLNPADNTLYVITEHDGHRRLLRICPLCRTYETLLKEEEQTAGRFLSVMIGEPDVYVVAQDQASGKAQVFRLETLPADTPSVDAIENGASFDDLKATGVAPNTWVTLFGKNLAKQTVTATSAPFPTTLGGSKVIVSADGVDIEAPVYYASPTQINFPFPPVSPQAKLKLRVIRTDTATTSLNVPLTPTDVSPGVFMASGYPLIQDALASNRLLAPGEPLSENGIYILYATGLGATVPDCAFNRPASTDHLCYTALAFKLVIGDVESDILFSGLTPELIGVYQINFRDRLPQRGSDAYMTTGKVVLDGIELASFPLLVR